MADKPRLVHMNEKVLEVKFEVYEQRLEKCKNCYAADTEHKVCKILNTPYQGRCRLKAAYCPQSFWTSNYDT